MYEIAHRVEMAKWGRHHWAIFGSAAIGYLMNGIVGSIAYLFYPSVNALWFLVAPVVSELVGDLGLTYLSDRKLGRRTTLYLAMLIYGVGSLLIVLATAFMSNAWYYIYVVALGIVLGNMGVQAEIPIARTYLAETMPLAQRERMLVLEPNFQNLGAALAALVGFIVYGAVGSRYIELKALGYLASILTLAALIVRLVIPESVRWLLNVGRTEDAKKTAETLAGELGGQPKSQGVGGRMLLWVKFAILIPFAITVYLTYWLMTYIIADFYLSGNAVNLNALIVSVSGTFIGLVVGLLINRIPIRKYTLASYVGGVLSMIPVIMFTKGFFGSNLAILLALIAVNMGFGDMAWTVRTILEPLLLPTRRRAFMIGIIRMVAIVSYTASIYLTAGFTLTQFVEYNLAIWIIGAIAAIYWFIRGYEVHGVSLEHVSGELLAAEPQTTTQK